MAIPPFADRNVTPLEPRMFPSKNPDELSEAEKTARLALSILGAKMVPAPEKPALGLALVDVVSDPFVIIQVFTKAYGKIEKALHLNKKEPAESDPAEEETPAEEIPEGFNPKPETVLGMPGLSDIPGVVIKLLHDNVRLFKKTNNPLYNFVERLHAGISFADLWRKAMSTFNVSANQADTIANTFAPGSQTAANATWFADKVVFPLTNVVTMANPILNISKEILNRVKIESFRRKVPSLASRDITDVRKTLQTLHSELSVTYKDVFEMYRAEKKWGDNADIDIVNKDLEKIANERILSQGKTFFKQVNRVADSEEITELLNSKELSDQLATFFDDLETPDMQEAKDFVLKGLEVDLPPEILEKLSMRAVIALHLVREEKIKINQERMEDVLGASTVAVLKAAKLAEIVASLKISSDPLDPDLIVNKTVADTLLTKVQKKFNERGWKNIWFGIMFTGFLFSAVLGCIPHLIVPLLILGAVVSCIARTMSFIGDTQQYYRELYKNKVGPTDWWLSMGSWMVLGLTMLTFLTAMILNSSLGIPIDPQVVITAVVGGIIWAGANLAVHRKKIREKVVKTAAEAGYLWQEKIGKHFTRAWYKHFGSKSEFDALAHPLRRPLLESEEKIKVEDAKTRAKELFDALIQMDAKDVAAITRYTSGGLTQLALAAVASDEDLISMLNGDEDFQKTVAAAYKKQCKQEGDSESYDIGDTAALFSELSVDNRDGVRKKFISSSFQAIIENLSEKKQFRLIRVVQQQLMAKQDEQNEYIGSRINVIKSGKAA